MLFCRGSQNNILGFDDDGAAKCFAFVTVDILTKANTLRPKCYTFFDPFGCPFKMPYQFALERPESALRAALIVIAVFTIGRIIALAASPIELYADETQYWIWSQSFDWGYFSKPPVIAWVIAITTGLFGDSDFAVRLASPLLHGATAGFLFLTGRTLWDSRTGFWITLTYLTVPAIWLSGAVISTDTPLFTAWSAGLYCLALLRREVSWPAAIGLGIAIGLGFMSKYAMIYFVIGTVLAMLLDKPTRQALLSVYGGTAALIGLAILSPNLLWNAANDFATVSHTAANANWGGDLFKFDELSEFLGGQLGVFGPAFFVLLVVALYRAVKQRQDFGEHALFLAVFIVPALLAVSLQSFISRAHANWAASAYVAGTLLITWYLLNGPRWRRYVLFGSIGFHSLLMITLMTIAASPALTEAAGMSNSTKRIRAWQETADVITAAGMDRPYTAVVFDNRNVFHQMQRYGGELDRPLAMWLRYSGPVNHAEQNWPLAESFDGEILIVSERPREIPRMREDFASFTAAGEISIQLDGDKTRDFTLWRASGHQRITRDEAYENRWTAVDAARDGG